MFDDINTDEVSIFEVVCVQIDNDGEADAHIADFVAVSEDDALSAALRLMSRYEQRAF